MTVQFSQKARITDIISTNISTDIAQITPSTLPVLYKKT